MYMAYEPCFSSRLDQDNYLDVFSVNGVRRDGRTNNELKRTCASIRMSSSRFRVVYVDGRASVTLTEDLTVAEARALAKSLLLEADNIEKEWADQGDGTV